MKQKFRAFVDGKLIDSVLPLFYEERPCCIMTSMKVIPVDSIDQFTGVLDIDKQEIYERDIVEVSYGVGQVVFHAGCYMIQWISDQEALMELLTFSTRDFKFGRTRFDLKKVGNVYGVPKMAVEKIPMVFPPNNL